MNAQVKVIKDKLVCIKQNHNGKVLFIVTDDKVPFSDRFLCSKCLETQQSVYKQVKPFNSAIAYIKEKIAKKYQQQKEQQGKSLLIIRQFCSNMNEIQCKMLKLFSEIKKICQSWNADLENLKKTDDLFSLIKEFEFFNSNGEKKQMNNIQQTNKAYFIKLAINYKNLLDCSDYQHCYSILKKTVQEEKVATIKEINSQQQNYQENSQLMQENKISKSNSISVNQIKLIQSIEQDYINAIAFNHSGNIMASGFFCYIKVWQFQNETLKEFQTLTGPTDNVHTIVFSQKSNWFASGGMDNTIKCWRENNEQWVCTDTALKHTNIVMCLIMSREEDQLISCSCDHTIVIWKVDDHKLEYYYSLDKHYKPIFSISVNESETLHQFLVVNINKQYYGSRIKKNGLINITQPIMILDIEYVSLMIIQLFDNSIVRESLIYFQLPMVKLHHILNQISNSTKRMMIIYYFQQSTTNRSKLLFKNTTNIFTY